MRYIRNIGAVISMALAMSACASTQRPQNYIDAEARPIIKEIDGVLIATQDELEADIKVSKVSLYAQGHFAPILLDLGINLYRSHKAHTLMKPIRTTMAESDHKLDLKAELDFALGDVDLEGIGELEILYEEVPGFRSAYIRNSSADAVMFIDVKSSFSPSFDALRVLSSIMIFPVNPELSPYKEIPDDDGILEVEDNIYRNQFGVSISVRKDKSIKGKTSENGAVWAEMSEDELDALMQAAARKLSSTIAADLRINDVSNAPSDPAPPIEVIPEIELPDFTKDASPDVVSDVGPDLPVLEPASES